jgi:hypothetical protein
VADRRFPDVTCPCGSGRKFADCCSSRRFGDPASSGLGSLLDFHRREFVRRKRREPGPDDLVFFDVPEPPEPPSARERIRDRIRFSALWVLWVCIMVPGVPLASPLYFKYRGTHEAEVFWWVAFILGTWTLAIAVVAFAVWGLWFLLTRP